MLTTGCPKERCQGAKWAPTGTVFLSRRGYLHVGVRCLNCGYIWPTGLPDALKAAKKFRKAQGKPWPTVVRRDAPAPERPAPTARPRQRHASTFTRAGEITATGRKQVDQILAHLRASLDRS
jgi:hypothetical protein